MLLLKEVGGGHVACREVEGDHGLGSFVQNVVFLPAGFLLLCPMT